MNTRPRTARQASVAALLACPLLVAADPACADVVDEVWLGAFAHDLTDRDKESGTANITLELDSIPPALLRPIGAPRVNATLSINTSGLTNFASLGLTWGVKLIGPLRATFDGGMAVHDGVLSHAFGDAGYQDRIHRLMLGSRVLFRLAGGLTWRLDDRWSIGAEYVHLSNGHILSQGYNEGINQAGLRIGYRFR